MRTFGWIVGVIILAWKLALAKKFWGGFFYALLFCVGIVPLIYQLLAFITGFGLDDSSDLIMFLSASLSLWLAIFIISADVKDD